MATATTDEYFPATNAFLRSLTEPEAPQRPPSTRSESAAELARLNAVPLLAKVSKGGQKTAAARAAAVLAVLSKRLDSSLQQALTDTVAEADGLPGLVQQLTEGNKRARRAALLLDAAAQRSADARAQIVALGAVPRMRPVRPLEPRRDLPQEWRQGDARR